MESKRSDGTARKVVQFIDLCKGALFMDLLIFKIHQHPIKSLLKHTNFWKAIYSRGSTSHLTRITLFVNQVHTSTGLPKWLWGFHIYSLEIIEDSGAHQIIWARKDVNRSIADLRAMLSVQRPDGKIPEAINWLAEKQNVFSKLGTRFQYSHTAYTDTTQMPVLPYRFTLIFMHSLTIVCGRFLNNQRTSGCSPNLFLKSWSNSS